MQIEDRCNCKNGQKFGILFNLRGVFNARIPLKLKNKAKNTQIYVSISQMGKGAWDFMKGIIVSWGSIHLK